MGMYDMFRFVRKQPAGVSGPEWLFDALRRAVPDFDSRGWQTKQFACRLDLYLVDEHGHIDKRELNPDGEYSEASPWTTVTGSFVLRSDSGVPEIRLSVDKGRVVQVNDVDTTIRMPKALFDQLSALPGLQIYDWQKCQQQADAQSYAMVPVSCPKLAEWLEPIDPVNVRKKLEAQLGQLHTDFRQALTGTLVENIKLKMEVLNLKVMFEHLLQKEVLRQESGQEGGSDVR